MRLSIVEEAGNKVAAPRFQGQGAAAAAAPANGVVAPNDPLRQAREAVGVGSWDATRAADAVEAHDRILNGSEGVCTALGWHRNDHE